MDTLTIFGAVTGGISATSSVLKLLQWAVATADKFQAAPEQALATLRDVQMIHRNLVGFGRLQEKWQLVPQDRLSCIPLEDTKNTLVDCISSLDELEDVLKPLDDPSLDALSLSSRLAWVMKDSRITDLSKRLHNAQSSLGLMLTIMQHESVMEVGNAVMNLAEVTKRIAQDVADILAAKRLCSQHGRRYLNHPSWNYTARVPRHTLHFLTADETRIDELGCVMGPTKI
ncbi:hypothetical protein B0H67DRAFT_98263 [Lasiosphaeris hirsuta]|uniref:Fungal N-terminal domain-containing protein n=1 Tax=Lasiosphaeris hirsuta TaxID=260670 RepID=A0AA39ZPJ0_9PEZI|nr:hypothetical protein B0H67DRAFT_98263 [Lasiosphaeris hirsuta]